MYLLHVVMNMVAMTTGTYQQDTKFKEKSKKYLAPQD